jgi:hypothetical protein
MIRRLVPVLLGYFSWATREEASVISALDEQRLRLNQMEIALMLLDLRNSHAC